MLMPVPPRRGRPEKPYEPPAWAWRAAALATGACAIAALTCLAAGLDTRLGGFLDWLLTFLVGAVLAVVTTALVAGLLALLRRTHALWAALIVGALAAVLGAFYLAGTAREALGLPATGWPRTAPSAPSPAVAVSGAKAETAPPPIAAPSPADPGPYEVRTLTYGPGARVALTTAPVDATSLVAGWNGLRSWYWGFGPDKLPVGGQVWYPAGEGPFPLVLMVDTHAGLGELLASRGYIAAAVDQAFLNGETAARAWLLLQHLEAWQRWNATVGTQFYRRVDMGSIALVGQGHGGDAAYLAAVLNELPYWPENAAVSLGFRFHIKAVAAIGPTDGRGQEQIPPLNGVSYLALQCARQYQRVRLPEAGEAFKAAVIAGPGLAPAEQQRIAGVYLSAFMDSVLRRGNRIYRPLFQDPRAGASWLPAAAIASQYADSAFRPVSTFDEDLDLLTTTVPGGAQRGEHFRLWREQPADPGSALYLAWQWQGDAGMPAYTIALPEHLTKSWGLDRQSALSFALADAREPHSEPGRKPLDLTVELLAADGTAAGLPLSHWAAIPVRQGGPAPVFQTYTLPLADFAAGAQFDPARVQAIRLRFDRVAAGAVLIDDVGFNQ